MNRPIPLFVAVGMVALTNALSFGYVWSSTRSTSKKNCAANDSQNKILSTLITESLAPVENKATGPRNYAKLTEQQKHAVRVFKEQRAKLDIPTCE